MGGVTFARASAPGELTLNTPRMPKVDYQRLKATYTKKLAILFPGAKVACLIEAPEKVDYGDIDFIIGYDERVDSVELAKCMGATGVIFHHSGFCSLAVRRQEASAHPSSGDDTATNDLKVVPRGIQVTEPDSEPQLPSLASSTAATKPKALQGCNRKPQPSECNDAVSLSDTSVSGPAAVPELSGETHRHREPIIYKHVNENNPKKLKPSATVSIVEYAQVDIEIIPSHLFAWRQFYSSYGDLGGLLGQIVRGFGFTISDKGLLLRMKELDDSKGLPYMNIADKDGLLWLSREEDEIMTFLGLDAERYHKGFATLNELYTWLGACRLLAMYSDQHKRDTSNDRQKEAKRTVFSGFFNEWLPSQATPRPSTAPGSSPGPSLSASSPRIERDALVEQAIECFDKRKDYDTMHDALVRNVDSAIAAHLLKHIIKFHSGKEDKSLNEIVRAFRRHAGVTDDRQLHVLAEPHADADSELYRLLADNKQSLKHQDYVSGWTKEHWEGLKTLERQRAKATAELQ